MRQMILVWLREMLASVPKSAGEVVLSADRACTVTSPPAANAYGTEVT